MTPNNSRDVVSGTHEHIAGRHDFHLLLAANPNYFGTLPDAGFDAVEPKSNDTFYEDVSCVAYSPEQDRVEATILVKKSKGYGGDLCTPPGSFEYVRFYIDYGSGWQDLGVSAVNVHDLPEETDCFDHPTHPLSYVCGIAHTPKRHWCGAPVLPMVRAVLSWNMVPPPNQPDWSPVWGGKHECRVQIAPRPWYIGDIASLLSSEVLMKVPQSVLDTPPVPGPDPGPYSALSLEALADHYRGVNVPPHRFAMHSLLSASHLSEAPEILASASVAKSAGINLTEALQALQATSGNTEYEQLECVGLDSALFGGSLVATFRVKQSSGYSGGPCSAGSTEYVAFWADWGDDCEFRYLGKVEVAVHDYKDIGAGLCYVAVLPVDLNPFRQDCHTPMLRRIRAVLSWNTPPSKTNPNVLPHWGNRVDAHVQIPPGQPYDGRARLAIVGGVAAQDIDSGTRFAPGNGLTKSGAVLGTSTTPLPDACPWAGTVKLQGPQDPALAGQQYRIVATNLTHGGTRILTDSFSVVGFDSANQIVSHTVTPKTGGWVTWPTYQDNIDGVLGLFTPGGDDQWGLSLELATVGNQVDWASVRMDNTIRNDIDPFDPVNAGDLRLDTEGECKVPHGIVTGRFVARDAHFWQWSIAVLGGPGGPIPPIPLSTSIPSTTQTPFAGTVFALDFSNPLIAPCGYVVQLTILDKAIVDSAVQDHYNAVDRGLCLT